MVEYKILNIYLVFCFAEVLNKVCLDYKLIRVHINVQNTKAIRYYLNLRLHRISELSLIILKALKQSLMLGVALWHG